jgi:hypothetical protein
MSQQEAPEGSAFGLLQTPDPGEENPQEGLQEGTQPETSEQAGQYEATEPGAETPETRKFAGKYDSVEALEEAYGQANAWGTRTAQEAAELRRATEAQAQQLAEMKQLLDTLAPSIIQQQLTENPELAEQLQQAQAMQALVDQRVAPYAQEIQQLRQREQVQTEETQLALRVGQWRQKSGIQPGTPEDTALANTVKALDLDFRDPETGHLALDLALEASRDPDLLQVLRINPHWIELEGGIEEARRQAAMRRQMAPAAQGNGTTPTTSPRVSAYVETGGQSAPTSGAPGGKGDEFDEAIAAYNAERKSPLLF